MGNRQQLALAHHRAHGLIRLHEFEDFSGIALVSRANQTATLFWDFGEAPVENVYRRT